MVNRPAPRFAAAPAAGVLRADPGRCTIDWWVDSTTGPARERRGAMLGHKRAGRPPGAGVAEATKERILEAAADVFAAKGYYGAAVDDIVRASDTSKGSFYFHFPNKRGIFTALLDHLTVRLFARVEAAMAAEPDAIRRLDAALRTVLTAFAQRRRLARLLLVEAAGLGHAMDDRLLAVHERFTALIRHHLDDSVRAGQIPPQDTALAACAWMGALNEVVVRWLYTGEPDPLDSVLPALRTLLLRSVGLPAAALSAGSNAPRPPPKGALAESAAAESLSFEL
jgi:AcrR family transcriptional regulator